MNKLILMMIVIGFSSLASAQSCRFSDTKYDFQGGKTEKCAYKFNDEWYLKTTSYHPSGALHRVEDSCLAQGSSYEQRPTNDNWDNDTIWTHVKSISTCTNPYRQAWYDNINKTRKLYTKSAP